MVPEVKGLLIDALKSGDYNKTKGHLKTVYEDSSSYCCLGVLCEVAGKETDLDATFVRTAFTGVGVVEGIIRKDRDDDDIEHDNDYSSYPPNDIRDWAGLTDEDMIKLANLNDEVETFQPVIDFIEANL